MEIRLHQLEPLPLQDATAGSEVWNQERTLGPGDRVVAKAQSGKGKTTLLSVLFGLRSDYKGTVAFDGEDIRRYGPTAWSRIRQRRLSIVFQDLQLFDELSAFENTELKNRLTQCKTTGQIEQMFQSLGLADKQAKPVAQLSLGQKQRLAIIRSLCQPFEFLLLDEPFSHLDPENLQNAKTLIEAECQARGAGLLVTSLTADTAFANAKRWQL